MILNAYAALSSASSRGMGGWRVGEEDMHGWRSADREVGCPLAIGDNVAAHVLVSETSSMNKAGFVNLDAVSFYPAVASAWGRDKAV
jgi:hypothetical protein